jgi:pimeloyl-ACP methyl ester carboxylesterase
MAHRKRFEVAVDEATLVGDRWLSSAPTVLFLHSGVSDRRAWYAVIERLGADVDAIAYDQRGHGGTKLGGHPYRRVDDALAVLDGLGVERALLVGNSMGGGIALDLALLHPGRVSGLVLIGTAVSGAPDYDEHLIDAATMVLSERIERALADGDKKQLVRLETWLWLDGPAQPEGRVSGRIRRLAEDMTHRITENEELRGESGLETWDRIGDIAVPTIVAVGEYDVPILIDRSRELAKRLPRASFRLLPGTAHGPSLDASDQVVALVRDALATADL